MKKDKFEETQNLFIQVAQDISNEMNVSADKQPLGSEEKAREFSFMDSRQENSVDALRKQVSFAEESKGESRSKPKYVYKMEELVPSEASVQAIEEAAAKKIEKLGLKIQT